MSVDELVLENEALKVEVTELKHRVEELERKLRQNSSNSSKPPSSDPPQQQRHKEPTGRKRGGQPGHKGYFRKAVAPDLVVEHAIADACRCGETAVMDQGYVAHQNWDLPAIQPTVTEHRLRKGRCVQCGRRRRAQLPADVPPGCLAPSLQAHLAAMASAFLLSKREIERYAAEMLHLPVSLGTVSNNEQVVSQALVPAYREANQTMKELGHQHIDETGFQRGGDRTTTWIKTSGKIAVLAVGLRRSRRAFRGFMGHNYRGLLSTDRYAVYDCVTSARRQLCWAHLLRAFKALVDEGGHYAEVGLRLLRAGQRAIHAFHGWRSAGMDRARFERKIARCRAVLEATLARHMELPGLRTIAKAFILTPESVWLFATTHGAKHDIGPTNNMAERDLRRFVLWKRRSFFSQSRRGDHFMARALTAVLTCRKQARRPYDFLNATLQARLAGHNPPLLLLAPAT